MTSLISLFFLSVIPTQCKNFKHLFAFFFAVTQFITIAYHIKGKNGAGHSNCMTECVLQSLITEM